MTSKQHYKNLRTKIVGIMAAVAIAPVLLLTAINYMEFQSTFTSETQAPFRSTVAKGKNSFELFLAERCSTVSLIASVYHLDELSNPQQLQHIFRSLQKEFAGFVDLGLIDEKGILVNCAGAYQELLGKDYSQQDWYKKARSQPQYVSDVLEGFRLVPHLLITVQHISDDGKTWIIRASLDIAQLNKLILGMNLEPGSDAFLINRTGVLQTDSIYYGKMHQPIPLSVPAPSYEANVINLSHAQPFPVMVAYNYLSDFDFILMAVKPEQSMFGSWFMLRADIFLIFFGSAFAIYLVAAKSIGTLIKRLRESDTKRDQAFEQMEHSQKLSSIGRLAAGVAHEINNPLAIINEKAGLLEDLLSLTDDFSRKEQFLKQVQSIHSAVSRCRDITHRMLGFARRMDVKIENLNINHMLEETLQFFVKEAQHRSITLIRHLSDDLPEVQCDRGQMQQVFLNVLNNAFDALKNNDQIIIETQQNTSESISISFIDNGCGMSEDTRKHIFEPFYTTKKDQGTGLGMSIIYGIIKRHGGDVLIESEIGKGTTVTIILPIKSTGSEA